MYKHIPNLITLTNLMSGCVGIAQASEGRFVNAAYCIIISAVLDFFDGFAARWLKAYSPIGKDLDSLADVVSFGVLPAFMLFQWINLLAPFHSSALYNIYAYMMFLPAASSALRLARFNHDETQKKSFLGLPTPAHALFWAAMFIALAQTPCLRGPAPHNSINFPYLSFAYTDPLCPLWVDLFLSPYFIVLLVFLFTWLLNAPIRLMAFKFSSFHIKINLYVYLFLGISLVLILWKGFVSAPIILFLYLLFSFIHFRKT